MSDGRDPLAIAVEWASNAPRSEIFEHRAFVRTALRQLEAAQRCPEIITMARATQGAMAHGRRWDHWERILRHAVHAADEAGDHRAAAWARHQLGTRALLLDELGEAWPRLHHALEMREHHDEPEAAERTRHNLRLLPLALSGVMTVLTSLVGVAALAITTIGPSDIPEPVDGPWILDIARERVEVAEGATTIDVELSNRGPAQFPESLIVASDDIEVTTPDGCAALEVNASCVLQIDISDFDDRPAVIEICYSTEPADSCSAARNPNITFSTGDRDVLLRPPSS